MRELAELAKLEAKKSKSKMENPPSYDNSGINSGSPGPKKLNGNKWRPAHANGQ
jgi:hypothetical protein